MQAFYTRIQQADTSQARGLRAAADPAPLEALLREVIEPVKRLLAAVGGEMQALPAAA